MTARADVRDVFVRQLRRQDRDKEGVSKGKRGPLSHCKGKKRKIQVEMVERLKRNVEGFYKHFQQSRRSNLGESIYFCNCHRAQTARLTCALRILVPGSAKHPPRRRHTKLVLMSPVNMMMRAISSCHFIATLLSKHSIRIIATRWKRIWHRRSSSIMLGTTVHANFYVLAFVSSNLHQPGQHENRKTLNYSYS